MDLFGKMPLAEINQTTLDEAYIELLRPDAAPATKLRQVLTPLRAVLEHAARRGWCKRPTFEVPRQRQHRTAFLTPDQATALVHAAAPHIRPLIVFLIGTGARMSEALELDWRDVDLEGSRVTFGRTKSGRVRLVDLVPTVRAALAAVPHREGRVFRPVYPVRKRRHQVGQQWRQGESYRDSDRNGGGQIKTAWAVACQRAKLPGEWREWVAKKTGRKHRRFAPALRPHDLRHTAASWHYAVHRDLIRLQAFGGWANVSQVQIYTHLLPLAYAQQAAKWLGVRPALEAERELGRCCHPNRT
jgi:integrase